MNKEELKGIIEAILFASGRTVKVNELINILELSFEDISKIISEMQEEYNNCNRGIEIVRIEDGFTLASKKEYHEYLYPALDKRIKPKLSQASLEVLSIIAYNQRVTKADIDAIRGVDSSGSIYRLQEYDLIEQAGKADLPGKPMTFKTTENFLKMFGISKLDELPELPKYKFDSNRQIVIEDIEIEDNKTDSDEAYEAELLRNEDNTEYKNDNKIEDNAIEQEDIIVENNKDKIEQKEEE